LYSFHSIVIFLLEAFALVELVILKCFLIWKLVQHLKGH
jgi:hypothetical protein